MNTTTKYRERRTWPYVLLFLGVSVPLSAAENTATGSTTDTGDSVLKMNPFLVSQDSAKGYLATDTLSGSKVAIKILDMPQTLNVISREAMDDSGLDDPNALFEKFAPGVSNLTGPGIEGPNAVIRGFRAQNWAVDGATTHYLSQLVSDNFDTIEVIKGPSVLLFGRYGGYGGYINVTMKTPHRKPINTALVGIGSANYKKGMIDFGQALGKTGNLQYRLVLSYQDYDYPYRNYDYNHLYMIAPSIAYELSPKTRLAVRFEYIRSDQSWTPSQLDRNGKLVRAFSSNEASDDMRNLDHNRVAQATLTSQLTDNWSLKVNTLLQTMSNDWKYTYGLGDPTPATPDQFYVFTPNQRKYVQRSWYGDVTLDWRDDKLGNGFSNDLFFNASFDNFYETIKFLANNMLSATPPRPNPLIDPTNPDYNAMRYRFDYPTIVFPYVTVFSAGAAVGETFGMFNKKLQFTIRGRYNYDLAGSQQQAVVPANTPPPVGVLTGNPAADTITQKPTFDWGLVYKPLPGWSVFYGHTEAYSSVATGFTVAGKRLDPEAGKNDEIGTKIEMGALGGLITGSLSVFSLSVSNKWRPDPFNTGFFVQDGNQENKGLEFQVGYANKRLSFVAGLYNAKGPYQKNQPATGIQPAGDIRAVWAPKITYDATLKVNMTERWAVGGGYRYQGNHLASTRLLVTPGFGTTDVFSTYTMKYREGQIKYMLSCTNLSDGTGYSRLDSPAFVFVQEGRRVKLAVSYVW